MNSTLDSQKIFLFISVGLITAFQKAKVFQGKCSLFMKPVQKIGCVMCKDNTPNFEQLTGEGMAIRYLQKVSHA